MNCYIIVLSFFKNLFRRFFPVLIALMTFLPWIFKVHNFICRFYFDVVRQLTGLAVQVSFSKIDPDFLLIWLLFCMFHRKYHINLKFYKITNINDNIQKYTLYSINKLIQMYHMGSIFWISFTCIFWILSLILIKFQVPVEKKVIF
jgi:hypothetical protein